MECAYKSQSILDFAKQARNDLVASPNGSMLLYIDFDGYIRGYIRHNVWDYEYTDLGCMEQLMKEQKLVLGGVTATKLLFAEDSVIYLMDQYGLIWCGNISKNGCKLECMNSNPANTIQIQNQVLGNPTSSCPMLYDRQKARIYYQGGNGLLYYFKIAGPNQYIYTDPTVANNDLLSQQLTIVNDMKLGTGGDIYFIGYQPTWGNHIHILSEISGWHTNSPSHSAAFFGQSISTQVTAKNEIAISPDENTVAYIGNDDQIYYFVKSANGWAYTYNAMINDNIICSGKYANPNNSLQFRDDKILFYTSGYDDFYHYYSSVADKYVYYYILEEDNCSNKGIRHEPLKHAPNDQLKGGNVSEKLDTAAIMEKDNPDEKVYPNPASSELYFSFKKGNVTIRIINISGKLMMQTDNITTGSLVVNTSNYAPGLYYCQIITQNGVITQKVIIRH